MQDNYEKNPYEPDGNQPPINPLDTPVNAPTEPTQPVGEPQQAIPPEEKPQHNQEHHSWSYSPNPQNGANDFNAPLRRPEEPYRWNFNDYQQAEQTGKSPSRNKGLRVFGFVMGGLLFLSVVFFAGVGAYYLYADRTGTPLTNGINGETTVEESTGELTTSTPTIAINDPPEYTPTPVVSDGPLTTTEIVKIVKPSVVGIESYTGNSYTPTSGGSGIIMDTEGYIITNAHVIEDATGISVTLDDGSTYFAKLIGSDTRTDLAVIKIEAENLTAATFGNSDMLEDGEPVVAIGNPGGLILGGTTTQGIVSSANRSYSNASGYSTTYIQTDAAINPGNSGGPLINQYGQIVGINSAKIVADNYEGIGFAIPINEAKPILDQLIQYGYVDGRCKIGMTGTEISEIVSLRDGIPQGIAIYSIEPTSDLAGKNVARNDILTAIDDVTIKTFDDVSAFLETKSPGDVVTMNFYRMSTQGQAGIEFSVDIKLIEDIEE